jgi:hypothetical protein
MFKKDVWLSPLQALGLPDRQIASPKVVDDAPTGAGRISGAHSAGWLCAGSKMLYLLLTNGQGIVLLMPI